MMSSATKKARLDPGELTPDGGYKVKTYYPTLEQMKDFSAFVKHIHDDGGHRAGLAKIVPPETWLARKTRYDDDSVFEMNITNPIKQVVSGESGLYQQLNVVQHKKMKVRKFKREAEEKHCTPDHDSDEALERLFWKRIFLQPSIYGADVSGTLFDDDCPGFNLTRLGTILDNIGDDYGVTIQGVNTTYLYFGMWKSSFCWHTEDVDLYSINYLHAGSPKAWYCISPEHGKRFERLAASFFPHSFRLCRAFLRHKTTLISPQVLKKYCIPFSRCVQRAGEFMITFPYSYHAGFNHGFNIAEATNFAMEYWIDFGKWATKCECSPESVKISMQTFVKRYQGDRYENWLLGRDICQDPRDPKHRAAAPKPTDYDLYLIGSHQRSQDECENNQIKQEVLSPSNDQPTSIRVKTKAAKKAYPSVSETCQRYKDYYLQDSNQNRLDISMQLPHYAPVPTNMVEVLQLSREISPKGRSENGATQDGSQGTFFTSPLSGIVKPDYEGHIKHLCRPQKMEKSKRKEKRNNGNLIDPMKMLQFLPNNYTLEKKFNRCIAASAPHCSVCQLLAPYPKDDEEIWGPKPGRIFPSENASQSTSSPTDNSNPDVIKHMPPIILGPKVDTFELPKEAPILMPRTIFIDNPERVTLCRSDRKVRFQVEDSPAQEAPEENSKVSLDFIEFDLDSSDLLQCTICMLCVHHLCYGMIKKPDTVGGWICDRCNQPSRSTIECELCPCRGGALKKFKDTWMHITCGLTAPVITFKDLVQPDSFLKKDYRQVQETTPICCFCSPSTGLGKFIHGRLINCEGYFDNQNEHVLCHKKFHTTCGHRNGAEFFEIDLHQNPDMDTPLRGICDGCRKQRDVFILDDQTPSDYDNTQEESSYSKIEIGSEVIAMASNGDLYDGIVEEYSPATLFDVYFPSKSMSHLQIPESRIVDYDPSRTPKVGDEIKVRTKSDEPSQIHLGKYRYHRVVESYIIKFRASGKDSDSEKQIVRRKNIFVNFDQLPDSLKSKYRATVGTDVTLPSTQDQDDSDLDSTPSDSTDSEDFAEQEPTQS